MSETITPTPTLEQAPPRRLTRVRDGRWVGGVAAGLGRYLDVNPLVYRIAFAALAFVGGTGLLLYAAAWLVMPFEDDDESIAARTLRENRDRPWLLLGVGLLGFLALLALTEANFWPGAGNVWLAALLAGAALVWWNIARADDERTAPPPGPTAADAAATGRPRAPRRPSLFAPVFGVLLAAAGLFGLLAALDVYELDVEVGLAIAVVAVGGGVAAGAFAGRRVGGLVGLGLILLAAFAIAAALPVPLSSGIGDRVERPLTVADVDDGYALGIGALDLDLSALELDEGTTRVDVRVGVGELVVTVPEGVGLVVEGRAGMGEIDVLGRTEEGPDAEARVVVEGPSPDSPVLEIDANVGFGALEVVR